MNTLNDQTNQEQNATQTWREARQQRREERRGNRAGNAWIGGAILILIGGLLLLQNFQNINLGSAWALLIMVPAIAAFGNAWRSFQEAGSHLTSAARGSIIGGTLLTMVTAAIIFSLNWAILGPVMIILVGLGVLLNVVLPA